jgi:hypothetical protein
LTSLCRAGRKSRGGSVRRLYYKALAVEYGDDCWNINRILRVPGTVNVPDEANRARGRVSAVAELVHYNPPLRYKLSEFTPALEDRGCAERPHPGCTGASGCLRPSFSGIGQLQNLCS